jgi:protein-S-isoprenylcysteine O-methyltransferase Ste14
MKLVENWKQAWRWFSVQALAAVALLPVVWPQLPPQVTAWLPESWRPWIIVALAVGGIMGRLIDQNKGKAPLA